MDNENVIKGGNSQQFGKSIELDWVLQAFVGAVNRSREGGIPITLLVSGFLVTGDIISGKQYFMDTAANFIGNAEPIKKYFTDIAETNYTYTEDKEDESETVFIHLGNARFHTPGSKPIPDNVGVSWRGKISDVSGYFFGTLSTNAK